MKPSSSQGNVRLVNTDPAELASFPAELASFPALPRSAPKLHRLLQEFENLSNLTQEQTELN